MSSVSDPLIVFFSSVTENTRVFVDKLGYRSVRLPVYRNDPFVHVDEDYVLIVPTYGGGDPATAVPKQVIKFLNDEENRSHCIGVIAAGNTNFGEDYCLAGDVISSKLKVPVLYRFELRGMPEDVQIVQEGVKDFYNLLESGEFVLDN